MRTRRIYKNRAEENFCQFIEDLGFKPTKRGWPDFICVSEKDKTAFLVEVKDTAQHPLKKEQHKVMQLLASYGLPCYRWDNENKTLQKIDENSKRKPDQAGKS